MYAHTHTQHCTVVSYGDLVSLLVTLSTLPRKWPSLFDWHVPTDGDWAHKMLAEAVAFHVEDLGEPGPLLQSLKRGEDVRIIDSWQPPVPHAPSECVVSANSRPVCILTPLRRICYGFTPVEGVDPKGCLNATGELCPFDKNNPAMFLLPALKRLHNGCDEHNMLKVTHKDDINKIGGFRCLGDLGFSTRASAASHDWDFKGWVTVKTVCDRVAHRCTFGNTKDRNKTAGFPLARTPQDCGHGEHVEIFFCVCVLHCCVTVGTCWCFGFSLQIPAACWPSHQTVFWPRGCWDLQSSPLYRSEPRWTSDSGTRLHEWEEDPSFSSYIHPT